MFSDSVQFWLISLICSKYFFQDCLREQVFVYNLARSQSRFSIFLSFINSKALTNLQYKHQRMVVVQEFRNERFFS